MVSAHYAPAGTFISASVIGNPAESDDALSRRPNPDDELVRRRGPTWRRLGVYRIEHAQPALIPPAIDPHVRASRVAPGLHAIGDHRATSSINGAMLSGRLCAESIG